MKFGFEGNVPCLYGDNGSFDIPCNSAGVNEDKVFDYSMTGYRPGSYDFNFEIDAENLLLSNDFFIGSSRTYVWSALKFSNLFNFNYSQSMLAEVTNLKCWDLNTYIQNNPAFFLEDGDVNGNGKIDIDDFNNRRSDRVGTSFQSYTVPKLMEELSLSNFNIPILDRYPEPTFWLGTFLAVAIGGFSQRYKCIWADVPNGCVIKSKPLNGQKLGYGISRSLYSSIAMDFFEDDYFFRNDNYWLDQTDIEKEKIGIHENFLIDYAGTASVIKKKQIWSVLGCDPYCGMPTALAMSCLDNTEMWMVMFKSIFVFFLANGIPFENRDSLRGFRNRIGSLEVGNIMLNDLADEMYLFGGIADAKTSYISFDKEISFKNSLNNDTQEYQSTRLDEAGYGVSENADFSLDKYSHSNELKKSFIDKELLRGEDNLDWRDIGKNVYSPYFYAVNKGKYKVVSQAGKLSEDELYDQIANFFGETIADFFIKNIKNYFNPNESSLANNFEPTKFRDIPVINKTCKTNASTALAPGWIYMDIPDALTTENAIGTYSFDSAASYHISEQYPDAYGPAPANNPFWQGFTKQKQYDGFGRRYVAEIQDPKYYDGNSVYQQYISTIKRFFVKRYTSKIIMPPSNLFIKSGEWNTLRWGAFGATYFSENIDGDAELNPDDEYEQSYKDSIYKFLGNIEKVKGVSQESSELGNFDVYNHFNEIRLEPGRYYFPNPCQQCSNKQAFDYINSANSYEPDLHFARLTPIDDSSYDEFSTEFFNINKPNQFFEFSKIRGDTGSMSATIDRIKSTQLSAMMSQLGHPAGITGSLNSIMSEEFLQLNSYRPREEILAELSIT